MAMFRFLPLLFVASGFSQLHLDMGYPAGEYKDVLLERRGYTLAYATEFKQARWIAYELRSSQIGGKVPIVKNYHEDYELKGKTAVKKDFRGNDYIMGFYAPEKDFKWSAEAYNQVFYYSNVAAFMPFFKKLIWRDLEEQVRLWAKEDTALYIFCGPVLEWGLPTIGKGKVSVPEKYYKIVVKKNKTDLKAIAFLMENEKADKSLKYYVVSIDSVESATGLDFLNKLDDTLEEKLESEVQPDLWTFKF